MYCLFPFLILYTLNVSEHYFTAWTHIAYIIFKSYRLLHILSWSKIVSQLFFLVILIFCIVASIFLMIFFSFIVSIIIFFFFFIVFFIIFIFIFFTFIVFFITYFFIYLLSVLTSRALLICKHHFSWYKCFLSVRR